MNNLEVDSYVGDLQVVHSGSLIISTGSETVIFLDPEDKIDEKFKVVFRFKNDSDKDTIFEAHPLDDGSPNGMVFDLFNLTSLSKAGVFDPIQVASNSKGDLHIAFIIQAISSEKTGRLFNYTFYRKNKSGRTKKKD